MRRHLTVPRPATAVAIALAASATIAACGGSSPSGSGTASTANAALKFAACVRAHGVPDYPDPRAGKITVDTKTLSESSQVVETALGRCQKYQVAHKLGPQLSAAELANVRAGALAYAKCMRAHGLENFPDPIVAAGPDGRGFEFGYNPKQLKRDQALFHSPAYAIDNRACGKVWRSHLPRKKG